LASFLAEAFLAKLPLAEPSRRTSRYPRHRPDAPTLIAKSSEAFRADAGGSILFAEFWYKKQQ
jgi:hypothetical protein